MKLETAEKIQIGDVVFDPFGCLVVVSSWWRSFDTSDGLYFSTVSDNLKKTTYHYKELAECDESMLCDEYKSYLDWIRREQKPFSLDAKEAYMEGYAAGFMGKRKQNSEEQLQK